MCTEISKEAGAYVIKVDELADAVNMFLRTSSPPEQAQSQFTRISS